MARGLRFDLLLLYAFLYMVFIYAPVLLLPVFSLNDAIYVAFPLKGLTFKWYEQMAANTGLISALENSVKVGLIVAVVSTIFGLLAAKAVTRYELPWKGPITGLIMLPLVVPYIILGIALLSFVRQTLDMQLSLFTIGAAHLLICVPFSMLVLISRLEGFDKNLEEASLDLGETGWTTFWRVTFPLAMPGIVASLLLSFTTSFDEFLLAFFLAGNETTLPIFIYSQLRFPNRLPSVLALGTCILVVSFVVVTFSEWLRRRGVQGKNVGI
jgi:spermidine/putrescine transport system permease protein